MTRSKSIIGALVLCALSLCAFGVASASATTGLTAVECKEKAAGSLFDTSHCETPALGGKFETVPFALNENVTAEGESIGTSVLKGTVALSKVEITCEKATTTGKLTNVTPSGSGAEMQVHGTEAVTKYTGCHASLQADTTKSCKVESAAGVGNITTASLTSTTGANHKVTLELPGGGNIAVFTILTEPTPGTTCPLPKTEVKVTGTVIADANTEKHSHLTFTGEGALKANGGAATYEGTNVAFTNTGAKTTAERVTVGLTTVEG